MLDVKIRKSKEYPPLISNTWESESVLRWIYLWLIQFYQSTLAPFIEKVETNCSHKSILSPLRKKQEKKKNEFLNGHMSTNFTVVWPVIKFGHESIIHPAYLYLYWLSWVYIHWRVILDIVKLAHLKVWVNLAGYSYKNLSNIKKISLICFI